MATVHSTSRGRSRGNRPTRSAENQVVEVIRLRGNLRIFLESERDALIRASSLLKCVEQAMQSAQGSSGPYYPDVVELAAELLSQRAANLDELLLDGRLPIRQN